MKIAVYSPYLDSLGGGEKYIVSIAEHLSLKEDVDIILDDNLFSIGIENIKQSLKTSHGLNLDKVNFIKGPIGKKGELKKRWNFLKQYDWLFYLTDGSIFYSTAKNSVIHFQIPFENKKKYNPWQLLKIKTWNLAICNSRFTEGVIKKNWPVKTTVVYPPVDVNRFKPQKKRKQILSVGRFSSSTKFKKHELMIETFKNIVNSGQAKGWSLFLAGGVLKGDEKYIDELKTMAEGFDIKFYPNVSLEKLTDMYEQSNIYWHAAGYGEDDPKKMEHFGISTVEAMAAGCVPVVINKGGQKEIVEDGKNGLLWEDLETFKEKTISLINNEELRKRLSAQGPSKAQMYNKKNFNFKIDEIVYK